MPETHSRLPDSVAGAASLDDNEAVQVLLFLDPKSSSRLRAVSRDAVLARASGSQSLWATYAERVFGLGGRCLGPAGETCGDNWTRVFGMWRAAALHLGLDDAVTSTQRMPNARWISLWFRMHNYLSEHAPDVADTLRRGGTASFEASARESEFPLGDRCETIFGMWQVFDGQRGAFPSNQLNMLELPDELISDVDWSLGLFGGFSAYDHKISTFLLPFGTAVRLTDFLRVKAPPFRSLETSKLAFACTQGLTRLKVLFVDLIDGGVYSLDVGSQGLVPLVPSSSEDLDEYDKVQLHGLKAKPELNGTAGTLVQFHKEKGRWQVRMEDGETQHLLKPENLTSLRRSAWPAEALDGLARWFEMYVRRLEEGTYVRMPLVPEEANTTQGINLFPISGPKLGRSVTCGVEVTASCIYMPENPQGWTYSIALKLVGNPSEWGFDSCQLHTRTWSIQPEGEEVQTVHGEAVIGFKPILKEGGWLLNDASDPHKQYEMERGLVPGAFRYQSASGRNRLMRGKFGGYITFVPGTVARPTGQPFQVRVPTFQLSVPKYIY